jgi:hypothetical protein
VDEEYVLKYLYVNGDKSAYVVRGHVSRSDCRTKSSIKKDDCSFERVEDFKYLGTNSTNQNYIHEKKSILKEGNVL